MYWSDINASFDASTHLNNIAQCNLRTGHVSPMLHSPYVLHCATPFPPKFVHFLVVGDLDHI